jgi:ribosome-binding protein aMBF1 (putative translation factor)
MRTYILNEAMRRCQICGKDCSGQEMELSIDKNILCLKCHLQEEEWQRSVSKLA